MLKKISIKKVTRVFTILLFISIMINIFLSVIKRETNLVHSDYKILVQETAGSSNYVEYSGHMFPKRGYTLASYDCDNNATITQNNISKALSFTGPANKCTLKFNIYSAATGQTLAKLQELSSKWEVNEGTPDFSKTSPQYKYTDNGFTGSASSSGSVRNQYYTYASSYTFDEETGTYSLVNPQVIRFNSSTNGNTLNNKYIVDPSGSSSSTAANASNLEKIYKVTAYTYILQYTISSIPSSTSSSFVCNDCGIWQTNDDYGTSYYVRGKYDNSYVKFADLYWRIVRINGDESLKLIYDGSSAHSNAQSSADRYLDVTKFNNSTNDNTYLGYMYGAAGAGSYSNAHANTNNSNIKSVIDPLYTEFLSSYNDYIADTIFCNDRSIDTKGGESSNTQLGYGTNSTQYAPRYRIYNTKTPSLVCPQKNDAFTVNDTENGNGALTYPIGLLTADEASMAGLVYGQKMPNNYLVRGKWFWTMSPSYYGSSVAGLFNVYEDGKINVNSASYEPQLVPVINLTPESVQLFTGTGTMSDPFVITEGGGTTTPKVSLLNKIQSLSASDSSLVQDGTSDNNLRYIGSNPNNYIYFNDELWRIIGVMNNIKDSNGTSASRVKIVRNESIGTYSWDSSWTNVNSSTGVNEWSQAKLMQLLNSGYDNVKDSNDATVNNSLYWNKGSGLCYNNSTLGTTSCSFNNSGLSEIAQNQIENINWNTGALNADDYKDSSNGVVSKLYTYERGTTTGKICSTTNMLAAATCNDSVTRTTNWIGKVALIYSTDYIYATAGGSSKTRTQCLNYYANAWNSSGYSDCYNNSWLYSSNGQWALSPVAQSSAAVGAMKIDANGSVGGMAAANPFEVRPAVYLKQDISYYSGSGTSSDPFIIN